MAGISGNEPNYGLVASISGTSIFSGQQFFCKIGATNYTTEEGRRKSRPTILGNKIERK